MFDGVITSYHHTHAAKSGPVLAFVSMIDGVAPDISNRTEKSKTEISGDYTAPTVFEFLLVVKDKGSRLIESLWFLCPLLPLANNGAFYLNSHQPIMDKHQLRTWYLLRPNHRASDSPAN